MSDTYSERVKYFTDRIHYERYKNGLTQKELADLLGIYQSAISDWETHRSIPSAKSMARLAELFNWDL